MVVPGAAGFHARPLDPAALSSLPPASFLRPGSAPHYLDVTRFTNRRPEALAHWALQEWAASLGIVVSPKSLQLEAVEGESRDATPAG